MKRSRWMWGALVAVGPLGCNAEAPEARTSSGSTSGATAGSTSSSPEPGSSSDPTAAEGTSGATSGSESDAGESTESSGASESTGDAPPSLEDCRAALLPETHTSGAPRLGIEEIEPGAFYVSYSGLDQNGDGEANETSNLFILKGAQGRVWLFGSGYGDPEGGISILRPGQDSVTDAATSVADVEHVVESCFGETFDSITLDFVAPHFHIDHIHQELFDELQAAGVSADRLTIHVHVDDLDSVFDYPWPDVVRDWDPALVDRFDPIGTTAAGCGDNSLTFDTVLGPWEARANPGHTPGSLNLRAGDGSYEISGAPFFDCPIPQSDTYFHIHGNLSWTDGAASVPG